MTRDVSDSGTLKNRALWRSLGVIGVLALGLGVVCVLWLTVARWSRNLDDGARSSGIAYGAHLAQECLGCHRPLAKQLGIPPIEDLSETELVSGLMAFRSGKRDNPTMVSVAKSLDDAQIQALAKYFQSQRTK